jgi:hypothetical protein
MPMLFWLPAVLISEMWSMAWAADINAVDGVGREIDADSDPPM